MCCGSACALVLMLASPMPQAVAQDGRQSLRWMEDEGGLPFVALDALQVAQADGSIDFAIPAQDLNSAVLAFAEASGLQVFYDVERLLGLRTPGVQGRYTPDQALDRLLAGTGLTFSRTSPQTITLIRIAAPTGDDGQSQTLDTIRVPAQTYYGTAFSPVDGFRASNASTATRSDVPVLETPASISVVTRDSLDDADIELLDEVTDLLAGFNRGNSFGGTRDRLRARGFESDILVNGSRRSIIGITDTYRVQRVEAVRGPSAALYGSGSGGAQVNVVTKRPLYEPFREVFVRGANEDGSVRGTLDLSQPLTADGSIAARINAVGQYEDSFRDFVTRDFYAFAPALRWDVSENTSLLFEGELARREAPFDRGIPIVNDDLPTSISSNFSEPDAGDNTTESQSFQATIQHFIDDEWTVTGRGGFDQLSLEGESFDNRALAPFSFTEGTPLLLLGGAPAPYSVTADDTIFRNRTIRDQERLAYFGDATVDGPVTLAGFVHNLTFGTEFRGSDQENRDFRSATTFTGPDYYANPCNIDISDPQYGNCQAVADRATFRDLDARYVGIFAQNRIELSPAWQVLFGLSYNWYEVNDENPLTGLRTEFDGDRVSPRVGVVHRVTPELSFYASYSEGFAAETQDLRIDPVTDEVLPPTEFSLIEVGVKQEWFDGRLAGTLSLFQQREEGILYLDPGTFDLADPDAGRTLDDGENRSRGVELELVGGITDQWDVLFNYAFIDAEIRTGFEPAGSDLAETPRHNIGLLTRYSIDDETHGRLTVGGGWIYESERRTINLSQPLVIVNPVDGRPFVIDDAGDLPSETLPGYHRVDLFASYQPVDGVSVFLRVDNVFDEEFVTSQNLLFDAQPGAPRTVSAGLRLRF